MQLQLQKLLPVPLKDRLAARPSDIWMQDLDWPDEAHLFVQAPSGTGKTTLVHMLYGLRDDYEGAVLWQRQEVKAPEDLARLRKDDVSIVFQDLRLFPELTTWENLELKRALTGTVTPEETASWLERLGMADKRNAPARTLSYGEQQRVAIIRSLLQPFRWLLMDEPFSHLDKANTARAAALILEVVRGRKASFLLADLDENNNLPYTHTLKL